MEQKDQPTDKFFQTINVSEKYAEKHKTYQKMIDSYISPKKAAAKYREFEEIVEEQLKQLNSIRDILGKDNAPKDIDSKTILAALEAAIDSKLSIQDLIKIQQKDQDALIKINLAQDDILGKWLDARRMELNQINIEKILTILCEQVQWVEDQTEILGLTATFRDNTRKEITKVTSGNFGMMFKEDMEARGRRAIFFKETHRIRKQYKIGLKQASRIMKLYKETDGSIDLNIFIKNYIENEKSDKLAG